MSPAQPHEWVSFEHDGETWLFDTTFLASSWHCIWGEGCLGVREEPSPEKAEGCCSFGAHFTDDDDVARVTAAVARLDPALWQHHEAAVEGWAEQVDDAWQSRIVDDACIFLNRPGFAGGAGCALHHAARRAGEDPWTWKPDVCWQLPLRMEYHHDENGHQVNTLREWRRHDWGDGGDGFHWWCTDDALAFGGRRPVVAELRAEIVALVGSELYDALVDHLETRPAERPVEHPAVRARP